MFGETVDITAAELLYRFSSDNLVICYIFTTGFKLFEESLNYPAASARWQRTETFQSKVD